MKIEELNDVLKRAFPSEEFLTSIESLSGGLSIDVREGYDFDKIKDYYFKQQKPKSADVLFVGNKYVYLIEFKSGFARKESNINLLKAKKEAQRCSIRLKACESEMILEKLIMNNECREFELRYVVVIDYKNDPLGAVEHEIMAISSEGGDSDDTSEKILLTKEFIDNSILLYRKEVKGRKIFYDKIDILYDYEYNSNPGKWVI